MRKTLVVLLAVATLLLTATLTATPTYAQTTTIHITPPSMTVTPCTDFTVDVDIADVVNLTLWQLKISFDPTLVECLGVVDGRFLEPLPIFTINAIDNVVGYADFGCIVFAPRGVTGSGTLATITFHCEGLGDTALQLYDTFLEDSLGLGIPHDTADGFVSQQWLPIGGVWAPVSVLELLAPWIVLAIVGLVGVVAGTRRFLFKRW